MADDPHIKRTLLGIGGLIVAYRCQNCAAKLNSPIDEVGVADTCPACGAAFIVPGQAERDRLCNEKIEKEKSKRALAEAKRNAKTEPASCDAEPPSQTDTLPPPLGSRPSRHRFIAAIATAASLAILAAVGLAFQLGRQSGVRPTTAEPQPSIRVASVWQRELASSTTPPSEKTTDRNPQDAPNWWENDPVADGAKERAEHEPSDPRRTIVAAEESVVRIEVAIKDEPASAIGSGFVLRPGVLVTNYHVIEDAAMVTVKFEDGHYVLSDGYLAVDEKNDLALLKCDTGATKSLPLGEMPDKLDTVYAIGSPRGVSGTISNGIVSGLVEKKPLGTMMIQTTAPISPGSSGGPLLNEKAEVIGVTTEAFKDSQNLNFAVATIHVAALETVAETFARPWRDLPTSTAAHRRAEIVRVQARVEKLLIEMADNERLNMTLIQKRDRAQQVASDRRSQCDRLQGQLEAMLLAGYSVQDSQLKAAYDQAQLNFLDAVGERNVIVGEILENAQKHGDMARELRTLRSTYAELLSKPADD